MSLNVIQFPRPLPKIKLGDRTRIVRREMGLTQERFALGLKEHLPTVGAKAYGAWEAGINEPDNKGEVCEALEAYTGYPREWFMGWADTPRPDGGVPGELPEKITFR